MKLELNQILTQPKIVSILESIINDQLLINMLSEDALNVLNKLQDLAPNLEKLLDHQKILVELFTLGEQSGFQVNKNCAEINQKCQIYLEQYEEEDEIGNLMMEQNQPGEAQSMMDPYHSSQFGGQYQPEYDQQYENASPMNNPNITQNYMSSIEGDNQY